MSAVRFSRALLPGMIERRWGRIINIASTSAREPDIVVVHYNSAKAGLLALSKTLANAHAKDGVLVNCVSPGLTHTPAVERAPPSGCKSRGRRERAHARRSRCPLYLPRRPLPIGDRPT